MERMIFDVKCSLAKYNRNTSNTTSSYYKLQKELTVEDSTSRLARKIKWKETLLMMKSKEIEATILGQSTLDDILAMMMLRRSD
ncbi:unnamed protein product [Absidia cylindrospora]